MDVYQIHSIFKIVLKNNMEKLHMKNFKIQIIIHFIALAVLIVSGILDFIRGPYFYHIDFLLSIWFIFMLALYLLWSTEKVPHILKVRIVLETISIAVFFVYLMQIRGYESYSPMDLIFAGGAAVYIGYARYKKIIKRQSAEEAAVKKDN